MPAHQLDPVKGRGGISALANNPSSQALVRSTDDASYKELEPNMKGSNVPVFIQGSSQDSGINTPTRKTPNYITRTQWITVGILTYVNLINYMDRYTIAGDIFWEFSWNYLSFFPSCSSIPLIGRLVGIALNFGFKKTKLKIILELNSKLDRTDLNKVKLYVYKTR